MRIAPMRTSTPPSFWRRNRRCLVSSIHDTIALRCRLPAVTTGDKYEHTLGTLWRQGCCWRYDKSTTPELHR